MKGKMGGVTKGRLVRMGEKRLLPQLASAHIVSEAVADQERGLSAGGMLIQHA